MQHTHRLPLRKQQPLPPRLQPRRDFVPGGVRGAHGLWRLRRRDRRRRRVHLPPRVLGCAVRERVPGAEPGDRRGKRVWRPGLVSRRRLLRLLRLQRHQSRHRNLRTRRAPRVYGEPRRARVRGRITNVPMPGAIHRRPLRDMPMPQRRGVQCRHGRLQLRQRLHGRVVPSGHQQRCPRAAFPRLRWSRRAQPPLRRMHLR
mmetsp:Transcript_16233/g.51003  ORF Transcript_16233/g.51003 Transcript_16233/m.51003 type:complete len:201 (+) Transcript_16233:289-891(+)